MDEDPDEIPDYWRAGHLRNSSDSVLKAVSCFPPRAIADFLVQIFFNYAETHYFYVEKSWLVNELNIIYNDPGGIGHKSAALVSMMLTVFAIGTQYAYLDSSQHNGRVDTVPGFSEDEIGNMFYQQSVRLLPEIIESSSLESVQACLLLAVYALPIDASGLGYVYVGLAIRLATQNGMHRKYSGKALSPSTIESRNRVWWNAYVLERYDHPSSVLHCTEFKRKICIFHGRPLSTRRSDVDVRLPRQLEINRNSPLDRDLSLMVASIRLFNSLEDVLSLFVCCKLSDHFNYSQHLFNPSTVQNKPHISSLRSSPWSSRTKLKEPSKTVRFSFL